MPSLSHSRHGSAAALLATLAALLLRAGAGTAWADGAPAPAASSAPTPGDANAAGAPAVAPTADPALDDFDGDGDVDADDKAILEAAESIEITDRSEGQKLVESARAVTVIDLKQARERSADLGELLSRAQGIQVRRSGGLGSAARISLNGLSDAQVRFFLDGVPLNLAGWGLGVANIPVEMIQRIDVHRGVVPVSFGSDALAGAIDLVTDPSWVSRAAASWQIGSFGTHRATAFARARDSSSGLVAGLSLFVDHADNDYPIDVNVIDKVTGKLTPGRVRRFHDAYTAAGGNLQLGVVERGVIRRALVRLHGTRYDKELQHNIVMTVPYGDVTYGEESRGASAELVLERGGASARLIAGMSRRRLRFQDVGTTVYDWHGEAVRTRPPGERATQPRDDLLRETSLFLRSTAELAINDAQRVRLSLAPTMTSRDGDDLLAPADVRDPLSARRDIMQLSGGAEHELRAFSERLENIVFAKYHRASSDVEVFSRPDIFQPGRDRTNKFGAGNAMRWRIDKNTDLKASYEYATQLPSVDQLFGGGVTSESLDLIPETSHNANLGVRIARDGRAGEITAEFSTFARIASDMIVLLNNDTSQSYQNVLAGRILGVEGSGVWTAPGGWATLDGSFTLLDPRNTSSDGTFASFKGDRIPNMPWLLGAAGASLQTRDLVRRNDEATVFASSRYVNSFFRGWESVGNPAFKQRVDSQLVHGVGVTYALRGARALTTTLELQNLTDAHVFDSFGVQRPGRSLSLKLSGEL